MSIKKFPLLVGLLLLSIKAAYPQENAKRAQMQFLGAFDSGQAGVNIYKMFDGPENVVCYLLMPEVAGRKPADDSGKRWIYDGNTIGSISCVKTVVHVSVGMQRDIIELEKNSKQKK